jgi:hypothetical protein
VNSGNDGKKVERYENEPHEGTSENIRPMKLFSNDGIILIHFEQVF